MTREQMLPLSTYPPEKAPEPPNPNWWQRWMERRRKRRFDRGYDFAAGELLSNRGEDDCIEYLYDCVGASTGYGTNDDFDDGVLAAISDLTKWRADFVRPLLAIAEEMHDRKVNTGKHTSPTLQAWSILIREICSRCG